MSNGHQKHNNNYNVLWNVCVCVCVSLFVIPKMPCIHYATTKQSISSQNEYEYPMVKFFSPFLETITAVKCESKC